MAHERTQGEDFAHGTPVLPDELQPGTGCHLAEIDSAERQGGEHVNQFGDEPHVAHAANALEDS